MSSKKARKTQRDSLVGDPLRQIYRAFSLSNPMGPDQDDVPALLRSLATHIEQAPAGLQVSDIVLETGDVNEFGRWPSFTVYFSEEPVASPG